MHAAPERRAALARFTSFAKLAAPAMLAALATLAACGGPAPGVPAAGVDDFGDTLVPASPPTRIVSLNPTTTELLFALGEQGRLVGRSHWDRWPVEALEIPDVGDAVRPNVEAILARRPDLVLIYASADNRQAAARLRAAGIATLSLRIDRPGDFARGARILGRILHDTASAAFLADSVLRTLARVRAATDTIESPTVFWPVDANPLIAIGRGSYLNDLIDAAGGRNIYAHLADPSVPVSLEDVLRRDPDVILADSGLAAAMRAGSAWRSVRAVREGRILIPDLELMGRPSVRMGEAAATLARMLHPGLRLD